MTRVDFATNSKSSATMSSRCPAWSTRRSLGRSSASGARMCSWPGGRCTPTGHQSPPLADRGARSPLIATQAPMAGDLRTISAVIHIATELERMADHAAGIARSSSRPPTSRCSSPWSISRAWPTSRGRCSPTHHRVHRGRCRGARRSVARATTRSTPLRPGLPRAADLHDGRPGHDQPRHPPALGRPQPRAHRRPGDQHLRAGRLRRHR